VLSRVPNLCGLELLTWSTREFDQLRTDPLTILLFEVSRHKAFFNDLEAISALTSARSYLQLAALQPSSSSDSLERSGGWMALLSVRRQVTAATGGREMVCTLGRRPCVLPGKF
jgi:hypothetical protein